VRCVVLVHRAVPIPMAHFCPACGEQCSCAGAQVSAGAEEEEIVAGCTHICGAKR
jgi:hypothetical protein